MPSSRATSMSGQAQGSTLPPVLESPVETEPELASVDSELSDAF